MTVKLTDKVYNEAGAPVQGAIVQAILTDGTATTVTSTDTTDTKGIWAFDSSIAGHQPDLADPGVGSWYDVRINSGQQYRLRYGAIKSMMAMVQIAQTIVIAAGQRLDTSVASFRMPARTSDPTPVAAGETVFRTDTRELKVHDGTQWWAIGMPVGAILPYGGAAAPTGFLLCDGSAVSRATFANLFALLSTTYGAGDGSTTFNVPNLSGRSIVGAGAGAGLTARTRGQAGGEEVHPLSVPELATHGHSHLHTENAHNHLQFSHGHLAQDGGVLWGMTGTAGNMWFETGHFNNVGTLADSTAQNQAATATMLTDATATGSNTGHNTMHPFVVVQHIIKA